ncbi:MAG TPA: peptidylprolyl isomerase [Pseudonocardiaceae bacterium]|nr:peptidylprolyl isomerase [Pseudonocardiaceae bacterium]
MTASHRRAMITCAAVTALLGLVAGCAQSGSGTPTAAGGASSAPAVAPATTTAAASAPPATGTSTCDFTATPDQPAPSGHNEGLPPNSAPRAGTVSVTLHTSQGDIPMTMPRSKAPCTVASFAFLATKGYFNQTPCHRLTTSPSLSVLQCGDPTGTGMGGPGYTIPDENPTDLPPAPGAPGASLYARGTLAMANTGQPHSGGSQFFLVYADSDLPPNYAVFGQVSPAGLTVLDKISKAGVAQGSDPTDGPPATKVTITSATVAAG